MATPGAKASDYKNLQHRLANILQEQEDLGAHGARRVRV